MANGRCWPPFSTGEPPGTGSVRELTRGFRYGTAVPWSEDPKWFSPDLGAKLQSVPVDKHGQRSIRLSWGRLVLDPQRLRQVLKQFVWGPPGQAYVDELLQVSINQDPADASGGRETYCERHFYVMQDANYNVLGLMQEGGRLVRRRVHALWPAHRLQPRLVHLRCEQ